MTDVAVVTGAGRGLGREVARRLAGRGLLVVATDVDLATAQETATLVGGGAVALAHDVRDPQAHRRVVAVAAERGRVTTWVNNAGVLFWGKAWEHLDEQVRLTVEVNLLGMMYGTRAAVDHWRVAGQAGRVLNVASMSSFPPTPGLAVYAASKAAVTSFTTSLHHDLRRAGVPVRVHALCPDTIETRMVTDGAHLEASAMQFSGRRLLTVEEVADAAVDLLDSRQVVRSLPRSRGALARLGGLMPRRSTALLAVVHRQGERRRQAYASRRQAR